MLRKEIGLPDNIEWLGVSCQVEAQLLVSLKYICLKTFFRSLVALVSKWSSPILKTQEAF